MRRDVDAVWPSAPGNGVGDGTEADLEPRCCTFNFCFNGLSPNR